MLSVARIYQQKPTEATKRLQSLQGQLFGTHVLMSFLKVSSKTISLNFPGNIISQTTGPKYLRENFRLMLM